MSRTRFKHRNFAMIGCVSLLVTSLAFAITACGGGNDEPVKDADYYLSLESSGWQTFNSNEMIPAEVHFTSGGNDLYTLEITLEEGEKFTVNQVGSESKIGYDKIFSSADDLTNGGSGRIQVAHSGTFALSYNSADDILTYNYTAHPLSVEITPKTTSLHVGDVLPYKVNVLYSDGNSKEENVSWESSNEAVITVDENGSVTALSAGTATLTATAYGFSDKLEITVEPTSVPVTGVRLDQHELSMEFGAKEKLNATVLPEHADSQLVSWSSDKESVVTVTQDGTVEAVGYGTATITVTTAQGGHEDSCEVTVVKHVESMRFVSETMTVVAGGKTKDLGLVFTPSDATNKEVEIAVTSGSDKAAVDEVDGKYVLRGLAEGTATVTATLKENRDITATCSVTVLAEGTELASMEQDVRVMIGNSVSLTVTLESSDISSVEWAVDSEAVATVSGDGATATVTGVDFGSTVVTATVHVESGDTYTASCNVLVADEWYFVYGYGLGKADWDYADYIADKNAAQLDELLFTEQSKGVYTLTRHLTPNNGFQIIFPQVASFTQHDDSTGEDVWSKNIPSHWVDASHYYSASQSDGSYVKNASEYFGVNAAGDYTITLDLTGTSAKVRIKLVSLDVTDVQLELTEGTYILRDGEEATVSFSVVPANATYKEEDVKCSITSDFSDCEKYLSYTLDFANKTLRLSVAEPPQSFTAILHLTVRGVEQTLDVYVLPENVSKTDVTEIHFEQDKYEFNVNNGMGNWTTTVKASVNASATNQQVRYYDVTDYNMLLPHAADERATVDPVTGEITARSLGTLKIKAVSLDDPSVETTVEVLIYSDQIYLVGAAYGGWTALSQDVTSTKGLKQETYTFTKESNSKYTYHFEHAYSGEANKFKIVFLGINDTWTGEINVGNAAQDLGSAIWGWSGGDVAYEGQNNICFMTEAAYDLTIDLSMHKPVLLIDRADREATNDFVLEFQGETELKKGDTASAQLLCIPFEGFEEDRVTVTYQGNDEKLLTHSFDEVTNTLTFTAQKQKHSEDTEVTVTIQVGNTTKTLTFTIVAEHHLELTWDEDNHWYRCTDENCTYIEDSSGVEAQKTPHDQQGSWSANAEGHYYACSGCGAEFGLVDHVYDLNNGVFDFSAGMEECSICHFKLFEIEGNTLKAYYGSAATVQVPNEVTVLGAHVFEGHTELETITYSTNLTEFGDYAFAGCTNLKSVRIGNYITRIGKYAFQGTAVKFTWGKALRLEQLGAYSFAGWLGTKFEFPNKELTIGSNAFENDVNLTKIEIPDTITNRVFTETFNGCTSLRYADLGVNVEQISCFVGCTALETVIIRSQKFWQFMAGGFMECDALKAIYLERPLSQLLTCNWMFINGDASTGNATNRQVKGKVFAYSADDPGVDPCGDKWSDFFGYYRDWFGGYWHWDESGEQELENIQLWETDETTATPTNMPVILDDRKNLYA